MASSNTTGTTPGGSASTTFFGNTPLTPARSLAATNFLAGDEPITIIPSFNHPEPIGLLSGQVGPFRAGMNVVVPLWLGTMLRRRKFAKIVPPPWMDVDLLKEVLKFERDPQQASFSSELPFRHAEIASAIFSACRTGGGTGSSGDFGGEAEIPNIDKVKLLLEDIATVRMDKIRRNVHALSSQTLTRPSKMESIINVTHIGSVEVQAIKPFVTEAFRMHRELSGKGSSYSYPVQSTNSSEGDNRGSSVNRLGGTSGGAAANASRGRLQARREREGQEDLPVEDSNDTENLDVVVEDQLEEEGENDLGRGRLRRHR
mmetsp:Transcript_28778/g.59766  ORF Transcript_28778/g.59766 Transcript_28778/m.59766 type:complete len:316 (-) Transcript_28778:148-1095(-)